MSNITTAFDAIKSKMQTLYPTASGYSQLTNPYNIQDNPTLALMKGWGVALNSGTNSQRELSCRLSIQRTITVMFTRLSQGNELLTANKETNTKALFEDQFTLIKELEKETSLNNNVSGITRFVYQSDEGIGFVETDTESIFTLATTFLLEYFENLNP